MAECRAHIHGMLLPLLIAFALVASPAIGGQKAICSMEMIPLDKRAEPTVEYYVVDLEQNQLRHMCGYDWASSLDYLWGCASNEGENGWYIYVEKRLNQANHDCVVTHEKAHLPPNLWVHVGSFSAVPGPLYRRAEHLREWHEWVATAPEVKPITYD
jgi:hypothetical protein